MSDIRPLRGVGPIVTATLIAELPELAASTAGASLRLLALVPWRGTVAGGRAHAPSARVSRRIVRSMLNLAAFQASRRSAQFKDFRNRHTAAGKPVKATIVATARKFLANLNAMLEVAWLSTKRCTPNRSCGQIRRGS